MDLFVSFNVLALQGFGGVLAVAQRELVERKRWYTREEFVEDWAVAQILPGPNVVNLALMFGDRHFGLPGAIVGVAGLLVAPMVLVLALAALYQGVADLPAAQGALRGMGAVAAGLVMATGLKLASALRANVMGLGTSLGVAFTTFVAVAWLRLPLVAVLAVVGGASCLWAWRQLGRVREAPPS
jgi:chromate transporter